MIYRDSYLPILSSRPRFFDTGRLREEHDAGLGCGMDGKRGRVFFLDGGLKWGGYGYGFQGSRLKQIGIDAKSVSTIWQEIGLADIVSRLGGGLGL